MLSLLDTVGCNPADFLLVYQRRSADAAWWTRILDPQYAHVEVWQRLEPGAYLVLQPFHDYLSAGIHFGEPEGIVQRVTARRRRGTPLFPAGVKTCVSVVKAALGIRAAWILTPRQLHDFVRRKGGVV